MVTRSHFGETIMNTQQPQGTPAAAQFESAADRSPTSVIATIAVLAFIAAAAGSVFLATPQSFESSPRPQALIDSANAAPSEPPERPFHERYTSQPAGTPIDPPTF